ncbi:MAG: HAD-IA family hydrolase [Salinisphaera sp.]|jgi:HAD superfamily hydrolase (TIGR01509 family)|nr:HAD-IA family hydrolase [Salinisphaera sp.]
MPTSPHPSHNSHAPAVEWLVFDLGGVLVEVAPGAEIIAELARRTATDPAVLADLLRERFVEKPFSAAERFQLGELNLNRFADELNRTLRKPISTTILEQAIEEILRGEKADMVALLAELAADWRIACYSNTNPVHWAYMRRHYGFFEYIEYAYASQEIGYAKPDRRGYDAVAAGLSSVPEHCLLIDDRQINIDGAIEAGWQALLFTDAHTLAADLAARGVCRRCGQ